MKSVSDILADQEAIDRVCEIAMSIFPQVIGRCFDQKIKFGKYDGKYLWNVPFQYVTDTILDMHSSVLTVSAKFMTANSDVMWLGLRDPRKSLFINLVELLGGEVDKWPPRGREIDWWWQLQGR